MTPDEIVLSLHKLPKFLLDKPIIVAVLLIEEGRGGRGGDMMLEDLHPSALDC